MAAYVEKVPNEPIVITYFRNPFDVQTDIPAFTRQLKAFYDAADQPIWEIMIATDLQVGFGEMVTALAMMTRGEFSLIDHPNAAGYAVVANQALIKLGAQSMTQAQYGSLRISVHETLEQALDRVRSEIRQQAKAA